MSRVGMQRPDQRDRSRAGLSAIFEYFGRHDVPPIGSPLYETLSAHVAGDDALLELAAATEPAQPPPNQLFAAAQYLLLGGARHPLRDHYPALRDADAPAPPLADVPARFSDFCRLHAPALRELIATRRTQTNVVRRASFLLPGFAHVAAQDPGRPLAQIEIGCSAGLNLNWHRFHYVFEDGAGVSRHSWGDPEASVRVATELRGEMPPLPARIPVASAAGVDLSPIDATDPDQQRWLRALIWPEHVERHARLRAAAELAAQHPPRLFAGDAGDALPRLLDALPEDTTACVFATFTLYQFDDASARALFAALKACGERRPVHFLGCELTGDHGDAELWWTRWSPDGKARARLATCNPHGHWLSWRLPSGVEGPSA
ncbi:MAG: DUF2332 domain-containing protein [Myxococcales bacterium]|nr:DUF2332 domain-containing protein [Myxococcales bacterium]